MKRVLVLSGGGVKGAIQLAPLCRLEGYGASDRIYKQFDLIVGSSVGAITGGMLATGKVSMAEYRALFLSLVHDIFKKKWFSMFRMPKYSREPFITAMDQYLGKSFRMRDCKTKFMCTSVNLCDNKTHYFKSWENKDGILRLKNAIARSFAAPYYFGMIADSDEEALWVDGGMGLSNCPLDIAYIETIRQGWQEVEFTVLGTGHTCYDYEYNEKLSNLKQVYRYLMPQSGGLARLQSTSNQIHRILEISKHRPGITIKYFDRWLPLKYDKLNGVEYLEDYKDIGSRKNPPQYLLEEFGEAMI